MNKQLTTRNFWARILIAVAFIVVAAGAWGIGRGANVKENKQSSNKQP